ncbi:MAG: hypothetical protein J2P22_05695 [Nocardioides sp.]|nr:hypothetical protein [Nocardioides sp.]
MSHTRCRLAALAGSLVACALLSGCSGGDNTQPAAADTTGPHRTPAATPTATPTSTPTQTPTGRATQPPTQTPTSGAPTSATTPTQPPATSALRFSPRSGGKHLNDCQQLVPGDDPAEFLYYPVLVKPTSSVNLHSVATDHTQGVVDAAAWVAPTGPTPETGTFKGWPPASIVTHDSNLTWSKRVRAAGATLDPAAGWYNVFLRLQVDPTPGDSAVNGIVFTYDDADGRHTETWVPHTTFSMAC